MTVDTWTGADGDGWGVPGSWTNGVPQSGDAATVPASTPQAIVATDVPSVGSVTDAGDIYLETGGTSPGTGSLNVLGALTIAGTPTAQGSVAGGLLDIDDAASQGGSTLSSASLALTGVGVLDAGNSDLSAPTTIDIGAGGVSNAAGVTGVNNGVGGNISLTGGYDVSTNQPTASPVTMNVGAQAGFGTGGHLTGNVQLSNAHIHFSSGGIQSIDANSTLDLNAGGSISSGAADDTNSALIGLTTVAGTLIVDNSSVDTGGETYAADTVTIGNHLTVSGTIEADNFVISSGGNFEITSTGSTSLPPSDDFLSNGAPASFTFDEGSSAAPATLTLDTPASGFGNVTRGGDLIDFGTGTALDLTGLTYAPGATAVLDGGTLYVTSDGKTEFAALQTPTATTFLAEEDASGGTEVVAAIVCFASGTLIRAPSGDVPVESLAVGDLVVTASGAARPIRWIGHRTIDCRRHPRPDLVLPVRIAAHAFGPEQPARDLRVSCGHAICVDITGEVLIPAGALVNGRTIVREPVDSVNYWHVELESHDILLAENLPAESYLEMGNRSFFAGHAVPALHAAPDAPVKTHADFCRPYLAGGPIVDAVRQRLAARVRELASAKRTWAA